MSLPQAPTSPHLYPHALQLKIYQAFIFSIPILFSIILFLLFYLFYLKRRASSISSPSQSYTPGSSNQATTSDISAAYHLELTKELKNNLPIVLFDEELRTRDSQCCVCLGEFEMKEELLQIPSCKHIFHIECIHHWLHSNFTCPLCRCFVVPIATKVAHHQPSPSQAHDQSAGSVQHHLVIPIHEEGARVDHSTVENPQLNFVVVASNLRQQ